MTSPTVSRRSGLPLLPIAFAGLGLAVSLALLSWAWSLRKTAHATGNHELPRLTAVPDFTTTSESGATVTKASLAGKVFVADFIFTTCQGICPGMTAKMKSLEGRLSDEPRIRFVSFTVDPDHDTPEVLARYAKEHGADPTRWSFLRTDSASLRRLCRDGFRLGIEDAGPGAAEPILHSTRFVLVDGTGTIRGYYDSDEPGAMEALAGDARTLAREAQGGR